LAIYTKATAVETNFVGTLKRKHIKRTAEKRIKRYGTGILAEMNHDDLLESLLDAKEIARLKEAKNGAVRLIDEQVNVIKSLIKKDLIDDFRRMELQNILNQFYTLQGKCERIKNYPLPRQYASISMVFVGIFIFLLPFGMMAEFSKLGDGFIWLISRLGVCYDGIGWGL